MKKILVVLFLSLLGLQLAMADSYVSPSSYDYNPQARKITSKASTEMQKVRAICDWICEHIQYDTDKQLVWVETDDGFDVGPIPANRYWFVQ